MWRIIVNEPDALPPEFLRFLWQSSLVDLGEECRPVWVGMARRRLIAAEAMQQ